MLNVELSVTGIMSCIIKK